MNLGNLPKQFGQFVIVGQLGLSLITPLLLCLFGSYYLVSKFSFGGWIYIPGFILGLGASIMTAWKVYLSVVNKERREKKAVRGSKEVSFSKHH
ncbi:MAG: AtpZ/AtpI family protein [Lachnospiraceae bacterium]|nr:AtpZ/AtpI family protein [Lachnospiraceae bacterium]